MSTEHVALLGVALLIIKDLVLIILGLLKKKDPTSSVTHRDLQDLEIEHKELRKYSSHRFHWLINNMYRIAAKGNIELSSFEE